MRHLPQLSLLAALLCSTVVHASAMLPTPASRKPAILPVQKTTASDAVSNLRTEAERSSFVNTGRYAEVEALCRNFAQAYPQSVRCHEFGRTPQGRSMLALVVNTAGKLQPQQARQLPVVLIQGGIHAGEIDGKDAGFWLLREWLADPAKQTLLKDQVLLFVPVFNVDGHERFGAWNRPNQRGPAQMGWRTTAQNYNLNRDYAKADSAEMQAMLGLVQQWDPLAYIDLHVTDGAQFEHDVSIQVEPVNAGDQALRGAGKALRDGVIARLAAQGSLPMPFYYSFAEEDNPASGFVDKVATPRFSHGYFHLRNRMGMLVELHSWKTYPQRVQVMKNTIAAVLQEVADKGQAWRNLAQQADQRAGKLGGQEVVLDYKTSEKSRIIEFRGYAYERSKSEISGATMVRYDESKPQIWRVPLRDEILPGQTAQAPQLGYLIPAAHADWVGRKLQAHGISFQKLMKAIPEAKVQVWRASQAKFSAQSVESHQRLEAKGMWQAEVQELAAGSLLVPIAQPKARLLVHLLEPDAPDSFLAWGFFNQAFEKKEYMEDYVAEDVARKQLAADEKLRAEFNARLQDPEFAANASARLEFFARRHPSWDQAYRLYPVFRLEQKLEQQP